MFEKLYQCVNTINRHITAPMVEERIQFLKYLEKQQMTHNTLRNVAHYLLIICDYLNLFERKSEIVRFSEIEQAATRWAERPTKPRKRRVQNSLLARKLFIRHTTQWLRFLGRLEEDVSPVICNSLIAPFSQFMKKEKGLSDRTIELYCLIAEDFLERIKVKEINSLAEISVTDVVKAFEIKIAEGKYARTTIQNYASGLRVFFRYAKGCGWCKNLSGAIISPRVYRHEQLPLGPSWDEVEQLLHLAEGDRPADIRDRAILLILVIYGLRNSEVVQLRLDDFDWEHNILFVKRPKMRDKVEFPLSIIVGEAVLRYLQEVRPIVNYREVFLTLNAPFRPLRTGLWAIVSSRLHSLSNTLPHFGPHALRHACAMRLLERGMSLKEIGDRLGHQDPDSTRIYAKVNLDGLRQVAEFDLVAEEERDCVIATRNHRLAAIHSLASFICLNNPEYIQWAGEIKAIPFKKTSRPLVVYLEKDEMNALLDATEDDNQRYRDHAILLFLYNTGARADETAHVKINDLHFGAVHKRDLSWVNILGKGNKLRRCPLWNKTVDELLPLIGNRAHDDTIFLNRNSS